MRPLDPRLLRYARATRLYLIISVVIGVIGAGLLVMQATLLAEIVSRVFFGAPRSEVDRQLILFGVVVVGRSLLVWTGDVAAQRCAARAKSELRSAVLARIVEQPLHDKRTGELTTVVTRGIDALDGFFSRYLSQLVLACIVPAVLIVWVATVDWLSVIAIGVVIPMIPVFMILVGRLTDARMRNQFDALSRLTGHFLDLVRGLPTLRLFDKAATQARGIEESGDALRRMTMANLRIAFLSSFVLELLTSIGVALAAVSVGLRLVDGEVSFEAALIVLFLAPEVYLPLRNVGAQFHANAEGSAAAEVMFSVIESKPATRRGSLPSPDLDGAAIAFHHVDFCWPGRSETVLHDVDFELRSGEIIALTGMSGVGKSTLAALLLRFVDPTAGRIAVDGVDLSAIDLDAWRRQIAWVPQRAHLFAGTIADNIRIGKLDASDDEVRRAADAANVTFRRLDARVGERGVGLSAGERQRVAIARAFVRNASFLILDEPTANLDPRNAAAVTEAVQRLVSDRRALVVSHREELSGIADRVLHLEHGNVDELVQTTVTA